MDQARALPRLPVNLSIPSSTSRHTDYKDSALASFQEQLSASSTAHARQGHNPSSDSDAFLQPRRPDSTLSSNPDAPAHRRQPPSPDLPKLSPSWNSSATSSSDTTRRSDLASWYSYPASTYPSLPNPYAHSSWSGDLQFDTDSPLRARSTASDSKATEASQNPYMLPIMSPTAGLTYAPVPPAFGGGLGAAFPEYLPYPYNPFSNTAQAAPATSEQHFQPPREVERGQVGPSEYTQALDIYRHIRAALPYIRAADAPSPATMGQSYRSILDVASTAVGVLSGIPQKPPPPPVVGSKSSRAPAGTPETKRARVSNGGDKEKPATFCRGCGATETPEWRRGPLGPRTLCNACGLVHMKMMRKKRKAEEKAAADAAAGK